jgi:hypothetical protein
MITEQQCSGLITSIQLLTSFFYERGYHLHNYKYINHESQSNLMVPLAGLTSREDTIMASRSLLPRASNVVRRSAVKAWLIKLGEHTIQNAIYPLNSSDEKPTDSEVGTLTSFN